MMFRMVIFASMLRCVSSHKDTPAPDSLGMQTSGRTDQLSLQGKDHRVNTDIKDSRIPLEAKEGSPVQISLIITNGANQDEAKSSMDHAKESTSRQNLSEMLLKPNPANTLSKEDVLSLIKLNNEIRSTGLKLQKMSESSNKILRMSSPAETTAQKDLVNYHVIEITENKAK